MACVCVCVYVGWGKDEVTDFIWDMLVLKGLWHIQGSVAGKKYQMWESGVKGRGLSREPALNRAFQAMHTTVIS